MIKPIRLPALVAVALLALSAATPHTASAAYKECEFTKKKAKRNKAPRCTKDLGKSRWIVVSGAWKHTLSVQDTSDNATFNGSGTAEFQAGGLNGNSAFPSRRNPNVSMVSTRREGVEYSATSTGGWTTKDRFYDCGFTLPPEAKPNGFGGIFSLAGKNVKVQWVMGGAGFRCDTPYGIPSPDFPDTVATYPLASFKNRRLVRLPIAFDLKDTGGSLNARSTYDGIARLRRYR